MYFKMKYEKPLSYCIKKLMYQVLKQSSAVVQGFLFFRNRSIIKAHIDEEECDELLKTMVINKQNVITYLGRKYIPTWTKTGMLFKDQRCIQKVKVMPDKTLYIHIWNSEPHKIYTDTYYIMKLLKDKGFDFIPEVKFYIEQLKISYQDVRLYNLCLEEFGMTAPGPAKVYAKQIEKGYGKLEPILEIKKRSVKRKHLRYYVKIGWITWKQLREVLKMEDYSHHSIRKWQWKSETIIKRMAYHLLFEPIFA